MPFLLVFAKPPAPGAVKTRLTALVTPQEAARLYAAMLADALEQYAALEVPDLEVRLCWGRMPQPGDLDVPVPGGVTVREQRGEGLGERMAHAFVEAFAEGAERVVIVGTDHPTLPSAFVEHAFAVLDAPLSVCIGPAGDGGFYLLGMNDFSPDLFDGMTYSHARVFDETMERVALVGREATVLPLWYDVDTPAALCRLARDLAESPAVAPATRATLAPLLARYDLCADA
jgi:rSAM/selenodomain-associated transferase 1